MKNVALWIIVPLAMAFAVSSSAQSWQKCTLPAGFVPVSTGSTYLDVFFLPSNPQYGWVCGFNGFTLRTTDGGNTWQGSVVPYGGRNSGHLESIQFQTTTTGYCSGPAGVFKSTDGGASWADLTAAFPNGSVFWGLYFLNDSTGCVIGGGCVGFQEFFRTSNGGQTWSTFSINAGSAGLTDLILYPNGKGIAVGSGQLFKSLDSGRTWAVWQPSFQTIWDEELCISGNSILLPYAGSDCQGSGFDTGGAHFSTDSGATWQDYITGNRMYGAFLQNPTTGWVCGSNRAMWRTTNSGSSWELKNCGVDGDLDDCWFINDSTAFVVGNAVYKMVPAARTLSKTTIDFGTTCFPVTKYDTLWVRNRSYNGIGATWTVAGTDVSQFSILQPAASSFGIASCDSAMVVVRFQPTSVGQKNMSFTVTFPDGAQLSATVKGASGGIKSSPTDTLITLANVSCGQTLRFTIPFINGGTQDDQILQLSRLSGSTVFVPDANLPVPIPISGGSLSMSVMLADTGWQTARFQVRLGPCIHDTVFTVRAYGVSPIVNAPLQRSYTSACLASVRDSIPVRNTGNADLVISNAFISSGSSDFQVVSWQGGQPSPMTIPPGNTKYLIIRYAPSGSGSASAVLRLTTNDVTTARGNKTFVDIALSGTSSGIDVSLSTTAIDIGSFCPGTYPTRREVLRNTGNSNVTVDTLHAPSGSFLCSISRSLPCSLAPGDSIVFTVQFLSDALGFHRDSLELTYKPCETTDQVIPITASRVDTKIDVNPLAIDTTVDVGNTQHFVFTVRNSSTTDETIDTLILSPGRSNWRISKAPSLPIHLAIGASFQVEVEADVQTETNFQGNLTVSVTQPCSTTVTLPIHVQSAKNFIQFSKLSMSFPAQICNSNVLYDTLEYKHIGFLQDTLLSVSIDPNAASVFSIVGMPSLPQTLADTVTHRLIIRCQQQSEGVELDSLHLRFAQYSGGQPIAFPLRSEFRRSIVSVDSSALHFRTAQPCDGTQTIRVPIHNRGTLDEDFHCTLRTNDIALSISSSDFRIAGGDSAYVDVVFDPSQGAERFIYDTLLVSSQTCPQTAVVTIDARIVVPYLQYSPNSFNFGSVWRGDSTDVELIVSNPSSAARILLSIGGSASPNRLQCLDAALLPKTIQPGDSLRVHVRYYADTSGTWNGILRCVDSSSCIDTTSLPWTAITQMEIYRAIIRADRKEQVYVGQELDYYITVHTDDSSREALFRARPTSLHLSMQFDDSLMNIMNVYGVRGTDRVVIPFTENKGVAHIDIPADAVRQLGASDSLLMLRVRALQHVPSETSVHLFGIGTDVDTFKDVRITTDDGIFSVQGCMLWVGIQLSAPLTVQILSQPVSDELQLNVLSSADPDVHCELRSLLGQSVLSHFRHLDPSSGSITIPVSSLASGVYFLQVSNSSGQVFSKSVVIQH